MNKSQLVHGALGVFLVGLCVAARLLPHPPNLTPLASVALLAGFYFRRRGAALLVPLAALAISDTWIGTYDVWIMASVYAALLFPVLLRPLMKGRFLVARAATCAFACAVVFWLTTNFAVWLSTAMYPHTLAGLISCYVAALPFFKYTLAGNLLWTTLLFGSYALAVQLRGTLAGNPLPSTRGTGAARHASINKSPSFLS